jgi:hypothetical protein
MTNKTYEENERAAYAAGAGAVIALYAQLEDHEARIERLEYLLAEAVRGMRYIVQDQREFSESLLTEKPTIAQVQVHAAQLAGVADSWLEDHAVEADELTGN